ncbi:MAG: putative DNA binding domain-containing protein [Bifidobacteriaceae bacterium]|jgi:ATP-dependent DNA helicase RecG|nr:putative DNA binding domain-containing protein [Bifidobacteriaceae bacterium]
MKEAIEVVLRSEPGVALDALIRMPEDQWYDRKSGRVQAKELAVPLVAFANAEGGYLAIGIHNGAVEGVVPARANDIRQAATDFTEPPVKANVTPITAPDGKVVLAVRVEPDDQVHVTGKGECYLRIGDENRRLTFAQRRELEFDRGTAFYDMHPVEAGMSDLNQDACADYAHTIGSSSIEAMLNARGLLTKDGRVTVAAWLLFADNPQALFPNAHVRVLQYADRDRGTGSRMTLMSGHDMRFEGPLAQQITKATQTVAKWLPNLSRLADDGQFRATDIIPAKAWEEGIINAVIHRSYSMQGDHIRVEVFPNRVEITSPGRFPGLANLREPMSIVRFARNPRIARVLAEMGIARELGEGIRRMFEHMRDAGLVDPIYQQSSMGVALTLLDQPMTAPIRDTLPATAMRILTLLQEQGDPLGTTQIAETIAIARPTAIKHLKALQSARLVVRTGESPRDPRASWRLMSPGERM